MRLASFTVTKYRSIKKANKVQVGKQTVLVGPNNEGKSNLIRALVIAMRAVTRARAGLPKAAPGGAVRLRHRADYDWERDYPQDLQEREPTGRSEVTLEFELTAAEVQEFRKAVRSELNGTLPIRISFGREADAQIAVMKKGPGGPALTAKSRAIAEFLSERANFEHIPAVRTASSAQEIVSAMLERELETLEADANYRAALESIANLQQPLLDQLSSNIRDTLVKFLPDVTEVRVQIPTEDRYRAMRRFCQITVDDGTATALELKGDGVQSLAALALMRHSSESTAIGRNLVIAIEEPESHLHPGAIHELRQVIRQLSERHQVVVTSHNPLFIDRSSLRNNVIVLNNRARPARTIDELRQALGVRASDNLRHAELVLIVEGDDDVRSVDALLRAHSTKCKQAIESGALALESLGGATNLSYKASLIRSALCSVHCYLDDDTAGKQGFDRARLDGLLTDSDVNWTSCDGMREAEAEDLYDPVVYGPAIEQAYRITLQAPEFRSAQKWSERMGRTFKRQGKRWDDRVAGDVKRRISEIIATSASTALLPSRKSVFDGLIRSLEARLDAQTSS
jgi:energy-coupling factor transporter ATP-binding protein EcfA2